jgi:hypothetical protein
MKAESPDKGTIAQVYLLRPVLPHLRTRIPKVENIKMPVAYGIEKPRFVRPNRQATALPGKQATDTRPKSRADDKPRHPGQKKGRPTSGAPLKRCNSLRNWAVAFFIEGEVTKRQRFSFPLLALVITTSNNCCKGS